MEETTNFIHEIIDKDFAEGRETSVHNRTAICISAVQKRSGSMPGRLRNMAVFSICGLMIRILLKKTMNMSARLKKIFAGLVQNRTAEFFTVRIILNNAISMPFS